MANYLKKKELYNLAKIFINNYVDCDVIPVKLQNCTYKFYRGSEWLEGEMSNGKFFKLYHSGYCSFEVFEFDDDFNSKLLFREFLHKSEWEELKNFYEYGIVPEDSKCEVVVNDVPAAAPDCEADKKRIAFENSIPGITNRLIHDVEELSYCELVSEYTGFKCKSEDTFLSTTLRAFFKDLSDFMFYFLHPGL